MGCVINFVQVFLLLSTFEIVVSELPTLKDTADLQKYNLSNSHINDLPEFNLSTIISTKQLPPPLGEISSCYPRPLSGKNQFIVGYGSLMQKASKERTDPRAGESIPIRIYGFTRHWNCKGESFGFSTTYLGSKLSPNDNDYFNGVIFRIPNAASLDEYDRRESYYCRKEILPSKLQILSSTPAHQLGRLGSSQFWIYVTKPEQDEVPSQTWPIVQSYVDTFLSGCFEQEDLFNMPGFANECVETTQDWSENWVNDRIFPRRPFQYQPMAGRIDSLLHDKIPTEFESIRIE